MVEFQDKLSKLQKALTATQDAATRLRPFAGTYAGILANPHAAVATLTRPSRFAL